MPAPKDHEGASNRAPGSRRKDFLSILSTNALALGQAALAVAEAGHFLEISYPPSVFSWGYNGNVAPFMKEVAEIRPFEGYVEGRKRCVKL
jgi:histidine ammonia-lyase